jgi:hypothetical protein
MAAMRHVSLTVYSADNLRETGFTKQDPYCVVEVGEKTFKTKPDNSAGPHPVWNEELTTEVPATVDTARVTIYNKNTLRKDDVIGVATIRLSDLKGVEQNVPVYDKDGNRHGDLRVFGTYGDNRGTARTGAAVPAMGAHTADRTTDYNRDTTSERTHVGTTGTAAGVGTGYGTTGTHTTGTGYGATTGTTGTHTGTTGQGQTMTEKVKEYVPGTAEYKATHGQTTGTGVTGTGYTSAVPATETRSATAGVENVCHQEKFTVMEDRPVVKERKEYFTEHHPVEREMVREVRTTGKEIPHSATRDAARVEERVVQETPAAKCP